MDLGQELNKKAYEGIVQHIYASTKKVFDICCKNAVQDEIKLNEENERSILNLTVSGDGS